MADHSGFGIAADNIKHFAQSIASVHQTGAQLAFVLGGGNFYRGVHLQESGLTRITGDQIGMLSTVLNSLALRDVLESLHVPTVVLSSMALPGICDIYDRRLAIKYLESGHVVLFAGGLGHPLFTTDTTASLRAIEIEADCLIKATNVDGIYDKDPHVHSDAQLLKSVSYEFVIEKKLGVMDLSAFCQCQEFDIHLIVCNILAPGALSDIIDGKDVGTSVQN